MKWTNPYTVNYYYYFYVEIWVNSLSIILFYAWVRFGSTNEHSSSVFPLALSHFPCHHFLSLLSYILQKKGKISENCFFFIISQNPQKNGPKCIQRFSKTTFISMWFKMEYNYASAFAGFAN